MPGMRVRLGAMGGIISLITWLLAELEYFTLTTQNEHDAHIYPIIIGRSKCIQAG